MADGTAPLVQDRVTRLVALAPSLSGYNRLAARHLFSELAHLETIAVMAAERGDGVAGQLSDERTHHAAFSLLAERYGGLVDAGPRIQDLIEYLTSLAGDASLAALNIVAESWLESVFDSISSWGIADHLFWEIEQDEARHVHEALKVRPVGVAPIIRDLEQMLEEIAIAPAFMLPLIHFGGEYRVSQLGLSLCDAHERSCKHLGITPKTHKVRLLARSQRMWAKRAPKPVALSSWEVTKQRIYRHGDNMMLWFDVESDDGGARFQARLCNALASTVQRNARLRTVTRRGQLYRVQESVIALRVLYDDRAVSNVFLPNCQNQSVKQTLRQMHQRIQRVRNEQYRIVPEMNDGLDALLPPSRCCVAVNYNQSGSAGTGPLSDIEGIPILVTFGRRVHGKITVTVLMDHRTHDGQDIGMLQHGIEEKLRADHEST